MDAPIAPRPHSTLVVPLAIAVTLGLAACGGDEGRVSDPGPGTGTLEVSATTGGATPDADGYLVSLDGTDDAPLEPNGTVTLADVTEGEHQLEISGLQVNCDPGGANPRTVAVDAGATTVVGFDVSCPLALLDRIVFNAERDGEIDIYFVGTDGSSLTRLPLPDEEWFPTTSPDGTRIAFLSDRNDRWGIWTVKPDGTGLEQVTDDRHGSVEDGRPAWSPDGSRIAFSSDRTGDWEIWTARLDGSDARQVTQSPDLDLVPDWSPDGSRIVFKSHRDGDFDIWTIRPDGTGLERVLDNSISDAAPAWSPDGARIAFQSAVGPDDPDPEIWIVDADGSGLEQVTDNAGHDRVPAWSPDGSRIAITASPDRLANVDIWLIDLDDGSRAHVTDDAAIDFSPHWTPEP